MHRSCSSIGARALVALLGHAWLALALVAPASADARDWNIVFNGKAIHIGAKQEWNEDNWGLGVEREFDTQSNWVRVALANAFTDSSGDMSYMVGGGIKRRIRPLTERPDLYVDAGVVGFLMSRQDVRDNAPFPGVLPTVTFGTARLALNASYVPGQLVTRATNLRYEDSGIKGILFVQLKLTLPASGSGHIAR